MTRADVGIAIGSGTDVAVQSADVILVQTNPLDVVRLVKLSKASSRKMQETIVWAAGTTSSHPRSQRAYWLQSGFYCHPLSVRS